MKKAAIWSLLLFPFMFLLMSFQDQPELTKLDWLVGQWVDNDEDVDLTFNYSWDENKHFLTNEFTISKENKKELTGKQILTWDPAKKTYRSWMFDSDGGFGNGLWKQKGDKWIGEVAQTLPDGRSASAIFIYKKINNDSYEFEATNRMIDGEMLPDIEPVTVVRKKN